MVRGGLSSVSFRNTSAEGVIGIAKAAGVSGIEWSADTHAPLGDDAQTERLMMATLRARLTVSAYGSFHRISSREREGAAECFTPVVRTGLRLQAPSIRVWGGPPSEGSTEILIDNARTLADIAGKQGITLCLEPHERSIVKDYRTLYDIVEAVRHPFFKACWAPLRGESSLEKECGIVPAELIHLVHVRNWTADYSRKSLRENPACLAAAIQALIERARISKLDCWALLEYIENEDTDVLKQEITALASLVDHYANATPTTPKEEPVKGSPSKSS
jgi:3-dehydroshikimate dehydratase